MTPLCGAVEIFLHMEGGIPQCKVCTVVLLQITVRIPAVLTFYDAGQTADTAHFRVQQDLRPVGCNIGRGSAVCTGQDLFLIRILIIVPPHSLLFQIIGAGDPPGGFPGFVQGRQQHPRQNGNDGNHHQKFY